MQVAVSILFGIQSTHPGTAIAIAIAIAIAMLYIISEQGYIQQGMEWLLLLSIPLQSAVWRICKKRPHFPFILTLSSE